MTRPVLAGTCALLLACGGEAEPSATPSTVTNVGGVLHVELPALPFAGAPEIEAEEAFTTSGRIELFQVTAGRLLEGGRLALANAGAHEILILDGGGDVERRIGGQGEGPGEFQWISALDVDSAGHIVAYDPRLGRLTRVAPDGEDPTSTRLAPPNNVIDILPLATLADGRIAAVYSDVRVFQAGGEARDTVPLMVFAPEGASMDTLGLWPGTEWAFFAFSGGVSRSEVGFGGKAVYTGRNGRFAIGSTDTLEISVFGSDGQLVMRISGGGRAAVRPEDVERWRQELIESRSRAPEEVRRALHDVPHRPLYPAFSDLALDDRGRIWIAATARPGEAERRWIVIGADGSIEGGVSLPASARILDVANDRIALLDRNDMDEEVVTVRMLSTG